ncbi:hypothetical protein CKO31_09845 [Thiohalocapsa halophila]|uniref:Tandem-95 repeat protein n=1 Tax=Thiohalocapsa halophila TaxID=69359 RepID=A0ABS1CGJ3_9GAMM|nr:carboxypeptidase regulatory-like domain-containing protein [Thiohalocapsa halophila]MBK1631037.1 hypothetical protein [Thiohalocapsa halophila]
MNRPWWPCAGCDLLRAWLLPVGLLLLAALPAPLLAAYEPVTDPGIEVTHPRPLYDRRTRTYWLDVTVTHQGAEALTGPLRLVVESANKTLVTGDGSTAAGEPYADLSTAADARFAPGDTYSHRLGFRGGRGQLLATLRLERDVPEVVNQPPVADAGPDQSLTLAAGASTIQVTLDGTRSGDLDGAIARHEWTGVPDPADVEQPTLDLGVGTYSFSLVVYDDQDQPSPADAVTVRIDPAPNQAPTADAGPDQTLTPALGETRVTVALDGSGSSDPDGNITRWEWGGDADPDDVVQPQIELGPGVWSLSLTVYDDQDQPSTPDTVVIRVNDAPQPSPPQLQVSATTLVVSEGETLSIDASATDPNGDVVSLSATPLLPNASFTSTPTVTPQGSYRFTPGDAQAGTYLVELSARDRWGLTDRRVVEIQVEPVNAPPALEVEPDHRVDEGQEIAIPFNVRDPDGDLPELSVTGLPGNAVLLPAQQLIQFAPDFDQAGTYDLVLAADDGTERVEASLRVTVEDVPQAVGDALTLVVDPVDTPTFSTRARVTGAVNGSGQARAPPAPFGLITGLAPTQAAQGDTLSLTLTGADAGRWQTLFAAGSTSLDLGDGISVDAVTVLGPSRLEAIITVAPDADPGQRQLRAATGDEIAVSVLAFTVLPGTATLTGVLRDSETGEPIADALISVEGTALRATSGADGSFSLPGVPAGERQLLVNAPDHALVRTRVDAVAGEEIELGEIAVEPRVLSADATPSASVLSLVARGIGDATRRMSFAEAEDITRDALMLVGGRDIGILDADGNQQNPDVGEDVPFWSFNEDTVSTIAERMLLTERRTLAEVLETYTGLWDWGPGEPPTLLDWLAAIQTVVDAAWSDPGDRRNALLFLLFNPERTLLAAPPTIVADLPLNALQATLMELTLLRHAARTLDPEALHDAIILDYPELAGAVQAPGPAGPSVAGSLLDFLVPKAVAAQPLVARAERAEYEVHVNEKLQLAALDYLNLGVLEEVRYQWSLTQKPLGSSPAFTRIDEKIAYLKPDKSGAYEVKLIVSAAGHDTAETTIAITAGDACDDAFKPKLSNADATWEEVACVFNRAVPKSIATGAVKGQLWGWLQGAAPISKFDAKLAAANDLKAFNRTANIGYPRARITAMKGLEDALPRMMDQATKQGRFLQFKRFGTKLLANGTAGVIQGQAATISRDIMYAALDKVIAQVVSSVRPAPPGAVNADPIVSYGTNQRAAVLVTFEISPTEERYLQSGGFDGQPGSAPQHFAYKIYRERPGGLVERIFVGFPGAGGELYPSSRIGDGKTLYAFVDTDPPEGQLSYFVTTRRIIGKGPVITQTWSESGFWIGQVLGVLSPPGMNQYNFAKAMSQRGINLLKQVRLQDSDPSIAGRIYLPRATEGVKLPVQLAATPQLGRYDGDILMSVPELDSVFSFAGGAPELLLNSGFKAPYQAGIAVDALGNIYMDNAASDQRFGGRIWRWNQQLGRALFGSVQYFSRLLMYSKPAAVQSMTAGRMFGGEMLFIADQASNGIRELEIPADGGFPPDPGHYVSQPITAPGDVPVLADTSMAVNDADRELLVTQGDNLFRYVNRNDRSLLFPQDASPFTRITGIDADSAGNLYVGDGSRGEIVVIPADKRGDGFYQDLNDEPWIRDLYTLAEDLPGPAELRVAGHQKALMWLDNRGMNHFAFGFSGRLLLPDGSPLVGARVSIPERLEDVEARTNEHGIFKLRGLRGPDLPDEIALLVRTRDGQVGQFQLLLDAVGHTFAERMEFVPIQPPPPPDDRPPPPEVPVVPVQIITPGDTTIVDTPVQTPETEAPAEGTAPVVAIVGPADGLETDLDQVTLRGFVIGGTLLSAVLERNDVESPLTVLDGEFETTVSIGEGVTRLRVVVESLDGEGNPVIGRSDEVKVFKTDNPTTGALTGRVLDEATGLPIPGASVFARDYGISALTDRNGVWQLTRVPPGDVYLEVVP